MEDLNTKASEAEISNTNTGEDTAVTQSTSAGTEEVKDGTDSTGDTVAKRELDRTVTKSDSAESDERDPIKDDLARRSYELTRKEIEFGVSSEGAEYLLNLDPSKMDEVKKKEVDAAIKSFWGKDAKTLEEAKEFLLKAKEAGTEDLMEKKEDDIDTLVARKVEELLQAKESESSKAQRESEEDALLKQFVDSNEILQPENDPGDKNWLSFKEYLQKLDGSGISFQDKLDMAYYKSFGDEPESAPSAGGVPSISSVSPRNTRRTPGLSDNKFFNILSDTTKKNLKAAGKI